MTDDRPSDDVAIGSTLSLVAPAKINLALEVLGKRDDGYHEVSTVLTSIDLVDRVRVQEREPGAGLDVTIEGPSARGIDPADDLAGRAARALAAAVGREPDLRIELTKRIPTSAGLGGGSSDAGAVLRGLNVLWELNWPDDALAEVGAQLGSDVPFFVYCGAAHCTGRGERVEPLRDMRSMRMLVMVPSSSTAPDKTARRYGAVEPRDFTDGHRVWRMAQRVARGAPPPTNDLQNSFEAVIERSDAELVAHYSMLRGAGAPQLHLSGSGPSVFALILEDARASALRRDLETTGAQVFEARTLGRAAALAVTRE